MSQLGTTAAEAAAAREYWGVCPDCGREGSTGDLQSGFICDVSWCRDCELLWRAGTWRDQLRENYADTFSSVRGVS